MSWLALLLVGFGLTDLIFSFRPQRFVPEGAAALAVVLLGLSIGLTSPADVVALILIAVVVVVWGLAVTRGFGKGPAWWPLAVFSAAVVVAIGVSGLAGAPGGWLATWLADSPIPLLADLTPDRALLLFGLVLLQLSTGNVLVRLVLAATHTVNPRKGPHRAGISHDLPAPPLKGGRLLGPLERLFILGLGLAGEVTAAGIVVAAKGLIRFPELQAARDAAREGKSPRSPGIHEITEYFLVGSFVSWTIALASLVLLAG